MKVASTLLSFVFVVGAAAAVRAETVATVAGETISREDLEKRVRPQLIELENNRYEILQQGLDEVIAEKLMAKEAQTRGISVDELRKADIEDKVEQPTDDAIKQLYESNKAQLGEATLDDLKPRIAAYLLNQRASAREAEFVGELKKKYTTNIALAPPKIDIDTGGRASRGGDESAPVTIIAFSDYECPFCKRAEETVSQVMSNYGKSVRYVHRDFPLPFHAHANEAAQAARCAGDQGKFWEFHDKLFAASDLTTEALQQTATNLSLDRAKFDECLASGKYKAQIEADIAAGSDVGVTGTPAFFINGRMLSGAQPIEKFTEAIDAELARAKSPKAVQ